MIYDVIIIGLGPAGYAASIYAKRGNLKTLVLEGNMPGGLLNTTNIVNNYPGFINITGPELSDKMYEHFKTFNIDYKNEDVIEVNNGEIKKVITRKGEYLTKSIIIATGRSRRSLNVPGEEEYRGAGISYCAICDAPFFKGKDIAVVGAGDSSLEEALYLSNIVKSVTIVVRKNKLAGNAELVKTVQNKKNINIMYNTVIEEIVGENGFLKKLKLNDNKTLMVSGLFIYIGFEPIIPFKTDMKIEKDNGYILVNENMETNIPDVYAVGDIIKKRLYQIISAESDGAIAATSIINKLTSN